MPTRPSLEEAIPEASSSSIIQHSRVHQLFPLFAQLSFYVIPAKLDVEIAQIYSSIEGLGGKSVPLEQARYVVTALKGRARLQQALQGALYTKIIVSADYVRVVYQLALESIPDTEPPRLPSYQDYLVVRPKLKRPILIDTGSESESDAVPRKRRKGNDDHVIFDHGSEGKAVGDLPDLEPFDPDIKFEDIPKLCVHRASPLKCINQDIIDAIKPIYEDREFEELSQKNSNVLSYRRSMSILKSVPRRLTSGKEAGKLVHVGEKVQQRIDEFLQTGRIAESEEILASSRYAALREFASVYTIGHSTARYLYDKHNCRTLGDVRAHYMSISEESEHVRLKEKLRRRKYGGMTQVDIVEEWMQIKDDLDSKIPREEVLEIVDCVMEHLTAILEGCEYTITGGFRRGKTESNDVDIVFCPPENGQDVGLLHDLYRRLSAFNIITHVLHVSQRAPNSPIHAAANNFDNLDKAFVIFKLPGKDRKHRRVDLISCPRERYAAGVLSWSGSMMFERDFKRYAEGMGYKFRAGVINALTGEEINLATEREIFAFLKLPWVPPELRNADG